MKYSDEQRMKKIYENAVKLHEYITENHIQREELPILIENVKQFL